LSRIYFYTLGIVKERTGKGQQYVIEWSDSTTSTQNASCIFGALTKNHALNIGDRVLAMADLEKLIYLPGWITAKTKNKLSVKFCDGSL
jgi:isocitrate lyase